MNFLRRMLTVCASLGLLFSLSGCLAMAPGFPTKMGGPGYSAGPVSEPTFPALVRDAVDADDGELRVFGKAAWHGFDERPGSMRWTEPHFSGVAVLTDSNIILLLWNQTTQEYELVECVPLAAIRFRPRGSDYSGAVEIDLQGRALSIGGDVFYPLSRTYLGFENPSGLRIDREKNRQAHALFEDKVEPIPTESAREEHQPIGDQR